MIVSLIWAMDEQRLIGVENRLPWKLPADMKWFRRHTLGKPIVMGRKTFESFGGRPLPERTNIVITRDPDYSAEGAVVVHSIEEALAAAGEVEEVMIIGGASFYEQMLAQADRIYFTKVHGQFEGDAWFPEFDLSPWRETLREEQPVDERNAHACSFIVMERSV
ncbi:dihydrofolate reductase [Solemya pervernicosa gill symbiont]|uniref:Dihydrofolate reductase n=2 Tax=Gammaproteobacteria incertae sedis TaxID=118884 RepID=A0A1T2L103_9GAMM|nr:type 3 dihydrofolate reductase [Candidatus Reidiella endopervernicosa]OOZ38787.1 dihydrofolate reductase [Solemya pervernicosa gill symbiont]QKQ25917.1 type 3 dihydrofolate reductase [Candidatus Reidiella endopervernicosa]